jgi:putative copper resistance protein D
VAWRVGEFTTCLLAFGLVAFDRLVQAPIERSLHRTRGSGPIRPAFRPGTVVVLLIMAMALGAGWLLWAAAGMTESTPIEAWHSGAVATVWTQTRFGLVWQARAACCIAAILVALALMWVPGRSRFGGVLTWILFVVSGGAVAGLAWAGHGFDGAGAWGRWHGIADIVHLLITAVWPVGLLPFAVTLWRLLRPRFNEPDPALAAALLTRRFSAISLASVALLTATGLVNAVVMVGSIRELYESTYGRVLLCKLVLFAVMIAIGAANLLVLKPRVDAHASAGAQSGLPTIKSLRRNTLIEFALGLGVVGLVALLGVLEPASR